jgi:hypothetical protein
MNHISPGHFAIKPSNVRLALRVGAFLGLGDKRKANAPKEQPRTQRPRRAPQRMSFAHLPSAPPLPTSADVRASWDAAFRQGRDPVTTSPRTADAKGWDRAFRLARGAR